MQIYQIIIPFLSFKSGAEEAASFYVSIFPDSKIVKTINNPATGIVMTVARKCNVAGWLTSLACRGRR